MLLDASDVRKLNTNLIRSVMWRGGEHTKQSVALDTGLSVSTCNTLLNELEKNGEIIGRKQQLHGVGRSTCVYRINEDYETILCIRYDMDPNGVRTIQCDVLSMLGSVIFRDHSCYEWLDPQLIGEKIAEMLEKFWNISCIIVGTNGFLDNGLIHVSDIPEMESIPLLDVIQSKTRGLPTKIMYDLHCYAYGAYKKAGYSTETVTFYHCPSHHLPGSASVINGKIVTGKNNFAGLTGYLPRGISPDEQIRLVTQNPHDITYVIEAITAIITVLNPNEIVFAGDIIDAAAISQIRSACEKQIPSNFLPKFRLIGAEYESSYLEGMYQIALEMKQNLTSGW